MVAPLLLIGFFVITAACFRVGPRDRTAQRPLLSAFNVVLLLFLVYIGFSAWLIVLDGYRFIWASPFGSANLLTDILILGVVGVLAFVGTYRLFTPRLAGTRINSRSAGRTPSHVQSKVAFGLVIVGLLLKLIVIHASGGLGATTVRLSGGIRSAIGASAAGSSLVDLRTLSGLADAGATWLVIEALRCRRRLVPVALLAGTTEALSFLIVGKRLVLLWPVLSLLVAVHVYRKPLTTRALPALLAGGACFGLGSLLVRVFLPARAIGVRVQIGQVAYAHNSILDFYFNSLEFSAAQMIGVVHSDVAGVVAPFGGRMSAFVQTNLTPILYAVPHGLWSSKPKEFFDVGYSVASVLTGQSMQDVQSGYISTIVGSGYLFGGILGVGIALVLLAFFASWVDKRLLRASWSSLDVVAFGFWLNLVFQAFRQGTVGWALLNGVVDQLGLLTGVALLALAARPASGHAPSRATVTPRDRSAVPVTDIVLLRQFLRAERPGP